MELKQGVQVPEEVKRHASDRGQRGGSKDFGENTDLSGACHIKGGGGGMGTGEEERKDGGGGRWGVRGGGKRGGAVGGGRRLTRLSNTRRVRQRTELA